LSESIEEFGLLGHARGCGVVRGIGAQLWAATAAFGSACFVVVDVETSGLYPATCRVSSVAALALDELGRPVGRVVSLIDAGCDPGPVHIHGLTRQRLAGAPRYVDVLPQLHDLLDGRVMVAHNASFDYGFLAAEASRAGTTLPTRHRLCTLALSRRLGVPVPNHKLGTLAAHWNVRHRNAHDSLDDAAALIGVFAHGWPASARRRPSSNASLRGSTPESQGRAAAHR